MSSSSGDRVTAAVAQGRYSALMDRVQGQDANAILQSHTDVLPGRPTEVEHRAAKPLGVAAAATPSAGLPAIFRSSGRGTPLALRAA
jgi:hypothetical protein